MITITFTTEFAEENGLAKLANPPAEITQLIQLVHFWATQHGITIHPMVISEDNRVATSVYDVPSKEVYDAIMTHAEDNGIDIFTIGAKQREFVESVGGTFTRVTEGI
jgi:hypothetical protein